MSYIWDMDGAIRPAEMGETQMRKLTEKTAADGTTYYTTGGVGRFRSKEVAQQVVDNHTRFAALTNREGMTADEREAAFNSFFGIKST
jgi:hypothetical protein